MRADDHWQIVIPAKARLLVRAARKWRDPA